MTLSTEILEDFFTRFRLFVKTKTNEDFQSFKTSKFVDSEENYKYKVYEEARESLGFQWWKPEDIGTGKIQANVASAIKTKVNHNFQMVDNNLVDWRKKDAFAKRQTSKSLETTLFNFYKSKIRDNEAFDQLIAEDLSYQFVAYLFFTKDSQKYLPISQEMFDRIFEMIGISDFKTRNNASWENYSEFCDIIKQTRDFLRTKNKDTTLLDAHSFLWTIGTQNINSVNINIVQKESELQTTSNSYLFAWNPKKWSWEDLEQNIEELQNKGTTTHMWSCSSYKSIKVGDRAFLMRLGSEPRGICGSGYVVSKPFLSKHWSGEDKETPRVLVEFDVLLNPNNEKILSLDVINIGNLSEQQWTPQNSGISIKPHLTKDLEALWFNFLSENNILANPVVQVETKTFTEGAAMQTVQTRYERNPFARTACLEHYGYSCSVCDFNFEKYYGNIGTKFIHVHHLTMVATIGKPYSVNPIEDLRPVCPNCHAMLHKQNPPLTIEQLKSQIRADNVN